jgi:hypothetical protein
MRSQVDDSVHQIPQDPSGKMRERHRILQESIRNRWNMDFFHMCSDLIIMKGTLKG